MRLKKRNILLQTRDFILLPFSISVAERPLVWETAVYSVYNTCLSHGWMICGFTSFFIVFQSYQDDVRMIMKVVCNGIPFTVEKISHRVRIELGPLDQ